MQTSCAHPVHIMLKIVRPNDDQCCGVLQIPRYFLFIYSAAKNSKTKGLIYFINSVLSWVTLYHRRGPRSISIWMTMSSYTKPQDQAGGLNRRRNIIKGRIQSSRVRGIVRLKSFKPYFALFLITRVLSNRRQCLFILHVPLNNGSHSTYSANGPASYQVGTPEYLHFCAPSRHVCALSVWSPESQPTL